jgi:hypothetical protein
MPDTPELGTPSVPEVRTRLGDAARLLRGSAALDPGVRGALAEFLDELGRALEAPAAPPAEVARLAEGAAHLAESLRQGHDRTLVATARDRLAALARHAEARAPTAVGLAWRLVDALAGAGI